MQPKDIIYRSSFICKKSYFQVEMWKEKKPIILLINLCLKSFSSDICESAFHSTCLQHTVFSQSDSQLEFQVPNNFLDEFNFFIFLYFFVCLYFGMFLVLDHFLKENIGSFWILANTLNAYLPMSWNFFHTVYIQLSPRGNIAGDFIISVLDLITPRLIF